MYGQTNTPAFQIINVEEPTGVPVTLDEIKAFSHIDASYTSEDANLTIIRDSAIQLLEGALNLYFTRRDVQIQFTGGICKLPYGPNGDVTSVTKNNETDPLDTDKYTVHGLQYKTIYIEGYAGGVTDWFYPVWGGWPIPWTWTPGCLDFFTVVYETGYEALPNLLKHALLMLIDYYVKEQGTTYLEIPAAIMQIASRFSQNLVIE